MDVEGCGRLSVHGGLLGVAWFCVCAGWAVQRWGDECTFGGGGW